VRGLVSKRVEILDIPRISDLATAIVEPAPELGKIGAQHRRPVLRPVDESGDVLTKMPRLLCSRTVGVGIVRLLEVFLLPCQPRAQAVKLASCAVAHDRFGAREVVLGVSERTRRQTLPLLPLKRAIGQRDEEPSLGKMQPQLGQLDRCRESFATTKDGRALLPCHREQVAPRHSRAKAGPG
jgi:hypothetical protein